MKKIIILSIVGLLSVSGCKKEETVNPIVHETGTVTDIDGNIYRTIKIGNQWWMAENLKVTRYRNGISIRDGQDSADWIQPAGAYCLYQNDPLAPGLLYNWFAIRDSGNLAPEGWHIPTDEEWKEMERNLGMSGEEADRLSWRGTSEGDKLRTASPQGWTAYGTVWSTNESGFSALAGSCRLFNSVFGQPGLFATGFWWTASEASDNEAMYRYLDYKNSNVFRSHAYKSYGFSIRCVKD